MTGSEKVVRATAGGHTVPMKGERFPYDWEESPLSAQKLKPYTLWHQIRHLSDQLLPHLFDVMLLLTAILAALTFPYMWTFWFKYWWATLILLFTIWMRLAILFIKR